MDILTPVQHTLVRAINLAALNEACALADPAEQGSDRDSVHKVTD